MTAKKLEDLDNKIRGKNLKESGMRLVESDEGVKKAEIFLLKDRTELYPEYRSIKSGRPARHIDKILGMSDAKVKTLTLRTLVDVKIEHMECIDFPNVSIHYIDEDGQKAAISLPLLDPAGSVKDSHLSVFAAFESRCFDREKKDYSGKEGLKRCFENYLDNKHKKKMRHEDYEKVSVYHSVFQGDGEIPELRTVPLIFSHRTINSYFKYIEKKKKIGMDIIEAHFKDLIGIDPE